MVKNIDADVLSVILSNKYEGFLILDIDLGEANPRYLCAGPRDVVYESNTYVAGDDLIGVSAPSATSSIDDQTVNVIMADTDGSIETLALNNNLNGGVCNIYTVINDSTGSPMLGTDEPIVYYKGRINGLTREFNADGADVFTIGISSPFADFDMVQPRVASKDFQERFSTTDTAFDEIYTGSDEVRLGWGKI